MTDVYNLEVTELESNLDVDDSAAAIDVEPPPDVYELTVDSDCASLQLVSDEASLQVLEQITDLTVEEIVVTIELVGEIGPPGRDGRSDRVTFTRTAGENISAQRVVTTQADGTVIYADSATIDHATQPKWLTVDAALAGDEVAVVAFGEVHEPGWNWEPGHPIFLGKLGQLTHTSPTFADGDAFRVQVASPSTPTDAFYDPRMVTVLGP